MIFKSNLNQFYTDSNPIRSITWANGHAIAPHFTFNNVPFQRSRDRVKATFEDKNEMTKENKMTDVHRYLHQILASLHRYIHKYFKIMTISATHSFELQAGHRMNNWVICDNKDLPSLNWSQSKSRSQDQRRSCEVWLKQCLFVSW